MTDDEAQFDKFIVDNKNATNIRCNFCKSLILRAEHGEYNEHEMDLPLMQLKRGSAGDAWETEKLKHFWLVKDMITFENIGFSHTVDKRKYLVCADCECGPIGYQELENKYCYVALKRVIHLNLLLY